MRPLIGIPSRTEKYAGTERLITYNNSAYMQAIEDAGGLPVLIPVLEDLNALKSLCMRLDGLLLSGGIDVDPHNYQEEPHPLLGTTHPHLDDLELFLARWAFEYDVPTLGICRGMQLLNVALGGDLYQDLGSQYANSLRHANWDLPRNTIAHTIQVQSGSRIHRILESDILPTNSLHHQAIRTPGDGVVISGNAEDGVAELLEVPDRYFMLAVQCHPEELYTSYTAWARLFEAFIKASFQSMQEPKRARYAEASQQVMSEKH